MDSHGSSPRIMVFQPRMDDFKDFNRYLESVEMQGAYKAGICKIVPPKEWRPRRESYSDIHQTIPAPIEQVVQGSKGIYTQFNVQKRQMSVSDFRRLANSTRYAPPTSVARAGDDFDAIERIYWKNITFNPPIYGADVSGSLTDSDQPYWNINRLGSILDTIYDDYRVKIDGVNTAYLYFGMWKTSFAWHTEDLDLYSINYLHFGEPKSWYAVPPEAGRRVERLAASYFPESARQCPAFLRHKMTVISPTVLRSNGIPLNHITQRAGEIMITFPFGYHAGFNHGLNCAESTNFALPRWVEYGKRASYCRCRKDTVRINMDVFVKKYQPERYEDWLAGLDVRPHPEDDQGWSVRRPLNSSLSKSASNGGAAQLLAQTPTSTGCRSMCGSSDSQRYEHSSPDNAPLVLDQSAPVIADRKRVVTKKRQPSSNDTVHIDTQSTARLDSPPVLTTTPKTKKVKKDLCSPSDSDSELTASANEFNLSQLSSERRSQSQTQQGDVAVDQPSCDAVVGSRSMCAAQMPPILLPVSSDASKAALALSASGASSPALVGLACDTLERFAAEWRTWASPLWTALPMRISNACISRTGTTSADVERAKRISLNEYSEQRTNRLLSRAVPHCAICSLFWNLQTRYETLSTLADTSGDNTIGVLPPRSTVLISEAVFSTARPQAADCGTAGAVPPKCDFAADVCDLLVCTVCNVVVHSSCYGHVTTAADVFESCSSDPPSKWVCRRCRAAEKQHVSFSELACSLCCLRFGALKPTADGRWAHIVCALGNHIPFGDLLRREPIMLGPTDANSRSAQRKRTQRQTKSFSDNAAAEAAVDTSVPVLSKGRCTYCVASVLTGKHGRDSGTGPRPTSTQEERRCTTGVCVPCYMSKPKQCSSTFHVTCGWLAGAAFEMLDWPILFSCVCYKHAMRIANESASAAQSVCELEPGQTVIAKNKFTRFYEQAKIESKANKAFCELEFLDGGQYSSDTLPEFIESHNLQRDGPPQVGTIVDVRWTDGAIYKAKFLGLIEVLVYEVEFGEGRKRTLTRNEIYTLDQSLPRKVKRKLKT